MKLSVVTTLYLSEAYIDEFYSRISKSVQEFAGSDYELIFVNDGSPDQSLQKIVEIALQDSKVVVLDLSRNFGHHKAIMTGLQHAEGDYVYLIDSDLEEEPEWLSEFALELMSRDLDVVYGSQKNRKGGVFERFTGRLFYSFVNKLAGLEIPKNPTVARLMKKRYVEALCLHREHELYIGGLMHLTGFDQAGLEITKHSKGTTVYTMRRKVAMLVNSITSLSSQPLVYVFYLGNLVFLVSFLAAMKIIVEVLFFEELLQGWASLITSVWIACGLIMSSIGILGFYLSKVFTEVKNRPYTIIKSVYKNSTLQKPD